MGKHKKNSLVFMWKTFHTQGNRINPKKESYKYSKKQRLKILKCKKEKLERRYFITLPP